MTEHENFANGMEQLDITTFDITSAKKFANGMEQGISICADQESLNEDFTWPR